MKLTDVRSDWPRVERTAERTNEWIWSGLLRCSGSDCVKCKNSRVTLGICMIILINKPCIGSFIPPHSRMSCNHNGHEHVHASRDCTQPNIINNYYLWWCSSMLRPHYRCWEIVPHANFMTSNNNYTDVIRKLYYCSTWTLNLHITTSIHPSCSCLSHVIRVVGRSTLTLHKIHNIFLYFGILLQRACVPHHADATKDKRL